MNLAGFGQQSVYQDRQFNHCNRREKVQLPLVYLYDVPKCNLTLPLLLDRTLNHEYRFAKHRNHQKEHSYVAVDDPFVGFCLLSAKKLIDVSSAADFSLCD